MSGIAVDVDYSDGTDESPEDYPGIDTKLEKGIEVSRTALESYDNPAVMWTGGKDSTLVLYLVLQVAEEYGYELPPVVFIDHFQHFEAVEEFVDRWTERLDLELIVARNDDVGALADTPGEEIAVADLNERNRREVREKLEYEDTFPFLLDTYVGNHLLKTVALNDAIEGHEIDGILSGVRWDEQEARADETFFSARHDQDKYPPHDRIHPILQFDERAVWDATWHFLVPDMVPRFPEEGYVPEDESDLPAGLTAEDIPISPKYWDGFRSLGSEVSTERSTDVPAWQQDLEDTVEREGRAQDKEELMGRLRDLGYMTFPLVSVWLAEALVTII